MNSIDIIAISACLISFLAFCVSVVTLIYERRQRKLDNLVQLHAFLHQDDLSKARRAIRESPTVPSIDDENFRRVCSSFDFAGTLVRHRAVNKAMLLDYWSTPLLSLEDKMVAVADQTTGSLSVKRYYRDFYWLIREANAVDDARAKKAIGT